MNFPQSIGNKNSNGNGNKLQLPKMAGNCILFCFTCLCFTLFIDMSTNFADSLSLSLYLPTLSHSLAAIANNLNQIHA